MSATGSGVEAAFAGQLPDPGPGRVGRTAARPRPHAAGLGRSARPRPRAAAGRGPPARPHARPRRPRHRQDHHARRGHGRPARRPRRASRPDQVLGLTFGRKAAQEWRERVTARVGGGLVAHGEHVPLVRLRARARAGRSGGLPRAPAAALRPGAGAAPARAAHRRGARRAGQLARRARARARHARPRRRGARRRRQGPCAGARPHRPRGASPPTPARSAPPGSAVGQFLGEYLDVLDAEGVTDYTEIVHRAAILAHDPDVQPVLRDALPRGVRRRVPGHRPGAGPAAARPGRSRHDVRRRRRPRPVDLRLPRRRLRRHPRFPRRVPGCRRLAGAHGRPALAPAASARSCATRPPASCARPRWLRSPREVQRLHRTPRCEGSAFGDGMVEVRTFDSESAEAGHIADTLRRAHLEQGVPWSEMAVLVRSGRRSVPPMRRALTAAGVPVEVAGDELPLHEEPAVAPLLTAARRRGRPRAPRRGDHARAAALPARRRRPRRPAPPRSRPAPRRA